jgi:hypothetical protein
MNLNLIFEEIKVKDFEGTIEILKTVKKGERIETIISKHQYKLEKKSSQDLLSSCQIDSINYKYFKRNIFEKIFLKKDINHLLRLISKESSYYSWILCPTIFLNDVKSSDIFLKKLVFEWEMEYLLFGNFNSATIIKNGEFMQIIQNSPLKMIKIS